ncbi:hypothetical protein AYI78_09800 [Shewanella algae]|nr:hypothetical protein AYI78_09800 [Shewanella algae]TVO96507.1 hypothetical protein AYI79_08655 [Shewanella algae]
MVIIFISHIKLFPLALVRLFLYVLTELFILVLLFGLVFCLFMEYCIGAFINMVKHNEYLQEYKVFTLLLWRKASS